MTRRRRSDIEISTFPFLSVLCAVIGVLMLFIIVIISTRAIEAKVVRSGHDGSSTPSTLPVGVEPQVYQALQGRVERLQVKLDRQRQQYRELHELHARLVDLLEAKEAEGRRPVRRPARLAVPDRVAVVPDPTRPVEFEPIHVEVTAAGYSPRNQDQEYPVAQLAQPNSPLRRFLDGVFRMRQRKYLVLLVRPNGVAAFERLQRDLAETYGGRIHLGDVPIPAEWEIVDRPAESHL